MSPDAAKKAGIRRKAFEDTLKMITSSGLAIFQSELESSGHYGDIIDQEALEKCLRQFFGESGTELLMHRIRVRNAELNRDARVE